jgi:hypothetical protein
MNGNRPNDKDFRVELGERLAVIALAADHFDGVDELQHLLEGLLDFLERNPSQLESAAETFAGLAESMPSGAVEILEFTMRELRWPAVKDALVRSVGESGDFRIRDQASRVLEVFEEDWSGGEIYRRYRSRD